MREEPGPGTRPASPLAARSHRAALKQLSALLTHRLSTLTSTISGYADLLVDTPSVQEQRQIAMNVLEVSAEINDLLADLRYYSRTLQPVPRTVEVRSLVRDTVALLDDQSRTRVRLEMPRRPGELRADPQLLRQALLGLLQNALEAAAPHGEVLLCIGRSKSGHDDTTATFEVWNEGTIPLDDPAEIFQPFFTTHAQRLGLGLPIAREIAERHGGTLQLAANSTAAGGTCLALHL